MWTYRAFLMGIVSRIMLLRNPYPVRADWQHDSTTSSLQPLARPIR